MDQKQMRELENHCIQEYAPTCTAACPIHIDVRAMLAAIKTGDFTTGFKILNRTLPFPGIISHICDQPCQAACRRVELDDGLNIAALERACVAWSEPQTPIKPLPRKPRRVAVIGGGLSGMTVAYDLARKGYEVMIYEATQRLGGRAWEAAPDRLTAQIIEKDLEVFNHLAVEIFYNTPIGLVGTNGHLPPLSRLCDEFEAVYLGIGSDSQGTYDLARDQHGRVLVDPATLQSSKGGVFAGGGMLTTLAHPTADQQRSQPVAPAHRGAGQVVESEYLPAQQPAAHSPILSICDGRKAAISIDRYLQRVSLTAARANEGSYTTRLYTNLNRLPTLPGIHPSAPSHDYTQTQAVHEAQRCIECECMECVKNCAYLAHYGGYPKKYIREIYNNLSIVMGTRHSNKLINSCSLCGLCAELCPEDLNMGAVCQAARRLMVSQKRMPPSAHDFALRDMAFSNSSQFTLARPAPGATTAAAVFFPGCQLSGSSPDYVEKIYDHLRPLYTTPAAPHSSVGLMLRCCGAPADWAGRQDLFAQSQADFMAEYERLGRPKLILACSSCYQMFKTHYPTVEIVSLWEVLAAPGGLPKSQPAHTPVTRQADAPPAPSITLALHDPCSTRYDDAVQDAVRTLLAQLNVQVEELPLNRHETECCSFGGVMWLANPELARETVQRRIQASPSDYITYCAMCRDFFARQGKPGLHILDLLYAADPAAKAQEKGPTFSERHANRAHLKRRLLKDLWSDEMEETQPAGAIKLLISPALKDILEERLILDEDIRQVVQTAQQTGNRLLNKQTHHFLASQKIGSVTYWVEYKPMGEAYEIYNAYCHRMDIGQEPHK